jgi:protein-S-isoprenylcysteine O-methyltransferase Ste14
VLEAALGAVWLIIAVKSGVIPPTIVVVVAAAPKAPKVAAGPGTEAESTARTSVVAALGMEVVNAAAMSLVVWAAVSEEGVMVKDRRAAQVAGSSPYVVVRHMEFGRVVRELAL